MTRDQADDDEREVQCPCCLRMVPSDHIEFDDFFPDAPGEEPAFEESWPVCRTCFCALESGRLSRKHPDVKARFDAYQAFARQALTVPKDDLQ